MTHHDNLAAVRVACIAANPEIEQWIQTSVNLVPARYAKKTREITLPDVLLALGRLPEEYKVDSEGWLEDLHGEGICQLDLRANLSGWSKEAVAALAALLKRDD